MGKRRRRKLIQLGREAYTAKKPRQASKYLGRNKDRLLWLQGYNDAEREALAPKHVESFLPMMHSFRIYN